MVKYTHMALIYSGIAVHTPVLIPTIGKDGLKLIETTKSSMERLEQELYIAQPDILMVISPHGESLADAISINLQATYCSKFEEFGDLVTRLDWKPATMLIDRFREDFKRYHLPLALVSDDCLDYGCTVPLYYLTQHLPNVKIVPVRTSSGLPLKKHYEIGKALRSEIGKSTVRVAVIASADLSHRVGENSPEGLSPKGVAFDEKVQEILRDKNPAGFLDIDDDWAKEASACGASSLAMLFGILDEMNHIPEIFSYEKPFGVGYLVASIRIA